MCQPMDALMFIRTLEEQTGRIKFQLTEIGDSSSYHYDLDKDSLLENAKIWFLRTIQNTDLISSEIEMPSADYISVMALETEKKAPYHPKYPALVWMLLNLKQEQIDAIFGVPFFEKISRLARTHRIDTGRMQE